MKKVCPKAECKNWNSPDASICRFCGTDLRQISPLPELLALSQRKDEFSSLLGFLRPAAWAYMNSVSKVYRSSLASRNDNVFWRVHVTRPFPVIKEPLAVQPIGFLNQRFWSENFSDSLEDGSEAGSPPSSPSALSPLQASAVQPPAAESKHSVDGDEALSGKQLYQQALGCMELPHQVQRGIYLFHLAAQRGHPEAQCSLGNLYLSGAVDGKSNVEAAQRWYSLAADQKQLHAQINLAGCYEGAYDGVSQSQGMATFPPKLVQAESLYREAAKKIIENVGCISPYGEGDSNDPVWKSQQLAFIQGRVDELRRQMGWKLLNVVPGPVSRGSSQWVSDDSSDLCQRCCMKFTLFNRRHHCRHCGRLVCDNCSKHRVAFGGQSNQRICNYCKSAHFNA
jgi:hypothetical protein